MSLYLSTIYKLQISHVCLFVDIPKKGELKWLKHLDLNNFFAEKFSGLKRKS